MTIEVIENSNIVTIEVTHEDNTVILQPVIIRGGSGSCDCDSINGGTP